MTSDERAMLAAVAAAEDEIATRPQPPAWRSWEVSELADLRANGPLYAASEWFNGGESMPMRVLTRYRRVAHRLSEANYLDLVHTEGGRLRHVRTTEAGRKALAAAVAATAAESPPAATGALSVAEPASVGA